MVHGFAHRTVQLCRVRSRLATTGGWPWKSKGLRPL